MRKSGINSTTPNDLLLGAGTVFKNFRYVYREAVEGETGLTIVEDGASEDATKISIGKLTNHGVSFIKLAEGYTPQVGDVVVGAWDDSEEYVLGATSGGNKLSIGQKVKVIVSMVDEDRRHIDFVMTDDKAPVELLGMKAIDELIQDEVAYYKNIYDENSWLYSYVNKYVNYEMKITACNNIMKITSFKTVNNKETSPVLLYGITGSGKTFTIANVIEQVQKPTLIISHNKTLAA